MSEWHVTPQELNYTWTEELLRLMFEKRKVRYERATKKAAPDSGGARRVQLVPEEELFKLVGTKPEAHTWQKL